MGLCIGARDIRLCNGEINKNLREKIVQKCSDTCARLWGFFLFLFHPQEPHSLAQVSEHFCTIVSRKFLLISPLQSRMSRAPMQRPMTSSSHDPMRAFSSMLIDNADHAAFMGALR